MRNSTRLRFFLAAASVTSLAALFVVACGDDDSNSDLTTPDAGVDTFRPDTGTPDTFKPDTGGGDGGGDSGGNPNLFDAGPTGQIEGGADGGTITCSVNGRAELEPNDDPLTANELRADAGADAGCTGAGCTVCGVIVDNDPDAGADAGDAGGTEAEYLSFEIHPQATSYKINYETYTGGPISVIMSIEGDANKYVIAGPNPSTTLPLTKGKKYTIEVKTTGGTETKWRISLLEIF